MSNSSSSPEDPEINQVFDDIAFSEDKFVKKAFVDGLLKGLHDGDEKGYRLGFLKGVEFGTEIGYYEGIVKALRSLHDQNPACLTTKSLSVLNKLHSALASFPSINCPNTDLIDQRDQVRSYYKQLCSLLKLDIALNGEELSF